MPIAELLTSLAELHQGHLDCAPTYEVHELGVGDPRTLVQDFLVDAGSIELQPQADWRPALRPWAPRVSAYGSLAAAGMFVVTLSFLVTTPQPPTGFLMKDLILLGAALLTAGEAFAAAPATGGQRRSSWASSPNIALSQTSPATIQRSRM